mmetsp:Transcript_31508/g.60097  ORF Transcript_31508/g.60097 Transcript_31508/m.60097 type:complete len:389 (+) Transcript_31508:6607-7773(+)
MLGVTNQNINDGPIICLHPPLRVHPPLLLLQMVIHLPLDLLVERVGHSLLTNAIFVVAIDPQICLELSPVCACSIRCIRVVSVVRPIIPEETTLVEKRIRLLILIVLGNLQRIGHIRISRRILLPHHRPPRVHIPPDHVIIRGCVDDAAQIMLFPASWKRHVLDIRRVAQPGVGGRPLEITEAHGGVQRFEVGVGREAIHLAVAIEDVVHAALDRVGVVVVVALHHRLAQIACPPVTRPSQLAGTGAFSVVGFHEIVLGVVGTMGVHGVVLEVAFECDGMAVTEVDFELVGCDVEEFGNVEREFFDVVDGGGVKGVRRDVSSVSIQSHGRVGSFLGEAWEGHVQFVVRMRRAAPWTRAGFVGGRRIAECNSSTRGRGVVDRLARVKDK